MILIDCYGIINIESKKKKGSVFMYINKRGVKVRNEEAIKGEVKFIISLTGNINNRVYSSTFQLLIEEDGIKAIEELYKLGE